MRAQAPRICFIIVMTVVLHLALGSRHVMILYQGKPRLLCRLSPVVLSSPFVFRLAVSSGQVDLPSWELHVGTPRSLNPHSFEHPYIKLDACNSYL